MHEFHNKIQTLSIKYKPCQQNINLVNKIQTLSIKYKPCHKNINLAIKIQSLNSNQLFLNLNHLYFIFNQLNPFVLTELSSILSQLQILFDNAPKRCKKQSQSGWSSNERVLLVKDKKISYYKLDKDFKENNVNSLKQNLCKFFVNIQDIYEVAYLPLNKQVKNKLMIIIPNNKIYEVNKMINDSSLNIGPQFQDKDVSNNGEEKQVFTKWIFQFQYDIKKKVQEFKQKRKEQQMKKNELIKNENNNQKLNQGPKQKMKDILGQFEDSQTQKDHLQIKESIQLQQKSQIPFDQYVSQIRKAKQILKYQQNKKNAQKQQKNRKRKEAISNVNENMYSQQNQVFPIQNHWRQYFKSYQQLILRKDKQKSIYEYQLILYRDIKYFKQTCQSIFKTYIIQKLNGFDNQRQNYLGYYFYRGIWIKLGGKDINQEFLAHYYIADIVYVMDSLSKFKFRIPDIVMVEYLGFKGLCMCDLPFSEIPKSQIYNLNAENLDMQQMAKFKQSLQIYEKTLNIKNQNLFLHGKKRLSAPLGHDLRIYQYASKKDLKSDQSTLMNFYYIVNIGILFPLDFNFQIKKLNIDSRLRPELITEYRDCKDDELQQQQDCQLLSQAFMSSLSSQDFKQKEDAKVIEASAYLLNSKIDQFVQKLNNLQILFIDSFTIKRYMSQAGINIRYMYKLHERGDIPYIQQMMEVQSMARTIKKQFYKTIRQIYKQNLIIKQRNRTNQNDKQLKLNFKEQKQLIASYIVDFLNLVFGIGQQTKTFWNILKKQNLQYFKIQVQYPFNKSPGCLLHAVLWHCKIQMKYTSQIKLFKIENPFSLQNNPNVKTQAKCYNFPSFQIQKAIKCQALLNGDKRQFQDKDIILMKLSKLQLLQKTYLFDVFDLDYQLSIAKINLQKSKMQKIVPENPLHPSQIPFYLQNKTNLNFEKLIEIMKFSLPDCHPLYISVYTQYSLFNQPDLMKKSAVLQSIKAMGEFHPKTTQLYTKLYQQGYKQFYLKSLRSDQIASIRESCHGMFQSKKYQSCMNFCILQINLTTNNSKRLTNNNAQLYIKMLFEGLYSSIKIKNFQLGIKLTHAISECMNLFKIRDKASHYELVHYILIIKLQTSKRKYFIYKMMLLCIHIQRYFNEPQLLNQDGLVLPVQGQKRQILIQGIMNEYYTHDNHTNWVQFIFNQMIASYTYFNYLDDLFNRFQYHIDRYDNSTFKECLGYFDVLIRLYGQKIFKNYLYDIGEQ